MSGVMRGLEMKGQGNMDKRRVVCSALVILAWAIPVRAQVVDAASGAAIQKAQEAQARQRAYRVAGTSRTNETNSWSLVYVSPDRYHYKETTGPALQDEIIMTGGEGWLNETRKKAWEPAIFDHSRMLREEFRSPPSIDAAGYRVTSVRALPASEVNGATAATYEYVVEKNKDTWLGDRLRRLIESRESRSAGGVSHRRAMPGLWHAIARPEQSAAGGRTCTRAWL